MSASTPSMYSSSGTTSAESSPSADPKTTALGRFWLAFGHFVFQYRNGLAPTVLAAMIVLTYPRAFLGNERTDALLAVLGLLVALSGQTLRVLVIGLAYIKRGGRKQRIAADRLVTDGVFAHCRNPLYIGNFLMIVGIAMVWNATAVYLVIPPLVALAYVSIVRAEEQFLSARFGEEYREYCGRVNRFVPDFRGFGETWARFSFDWKRVVRKEYGTTFSLLSTLLALVAIEKLRRLGISAAAPTLRAVILTWLGVAALWVVAGRLKKSGRLDSPD